MVKKLNAQEIGIPQFSFTFSKAEKLSKKITLFDLSSHGRAREAIDFGLNIQEPEFNIFVIGEDRTGRLQATLDYIETYRIVTKESMDDWVYLYNFENPQEPLPFNLPNGRAVEFARALNQFIKFFTFSLIKKLNSENFSKKVKKSTKKLEHDIQAQLEDLRAYALNHNIDIVRNPDGTISPIHLLGQQENPKSKKKKAKPSMPSTAVWEEITERLQSISSYAETGSEQLVEAVEKIKSWEAERILKILSQRYLDKFREISCLQSWLKDLEHDILTHLSWFAQEKGAEEAAADEESIQNRYMVNVFVKGLKKRLPLIVEPNPTYENVFGRILYKNAPNGYTTNFSMISAGSLHRANGGILVLRADALAFNPETWKYLKDALRDREIRIEEFHRANTVPMFEAPKPKPIPLDVKVILIGSPTWFYNYFYLDSDFKTYFKIKADINSTFKASPKNLSTMASLLQDRSFSRLGMPCEKEAIAYVIGYSARISGDRQKLSARFEALLDILIEAGTLARIQKKKQVRLEDVQEAVHRRDYRNALVETQTLKMLEEGVLKISVKGSKIAQINGLTVQEVGGYNFGTPSRITARTSPGEKGVINLERAVELSGPIQQKGVLILEGFLKGTFAQKMPLSCDCSLTFEQNYGAVEGDSASAAELCVILSSLSQTPLYQNIAITGSMNQFGEMQAVGRVSEKIEGFFKVCEKMGLTGDQGVIIPHSNKMNVILSEKVTDAVTAGRFHIWTASHVTDALTVLTGKPSQQIFSQAQKVLTTYSNLYATRRKSTLNSKR